MASISEVTDCRMLLLDAEEIVRRLNRKLTGWANYFCLDPVSPAYHTLDTHARQRLRRWLCKKHKVPGRGAKRYPDKYLHEDLGLVYLAARTHNLPWAKACVLVREPGAGKRPAGFDERDVETESRLGS